MLKKIVLISAISILLSACSLSSQNKEVSPSQTDSETISSENKEYSLEDVGMHNSEQDCWLAIDGKVYDVTKFIPKHPGEKAILSGCGIDATELFNTRPMGSGTPHSDKARDNLENFYIGKLET